MAYEQKPGDFAIFKNERKEKDSQPGYTGNGVDLGGNKVQIACWLKEGKNGQFFSCIMKPPYEKGEKKGQASGGATLDDDIPF